MLEYILAALSAIIFACSVIMALNYRRKSGGDGAEAMPYRTVLPAAVFALAACAAFAGFKVLYPLTPEYRYWIEADWRGRWSECPGGGVSGWIEAILVLALLVFGIAVSRRTVKLLSADGIFTSRRYLPAILLTEGSMVVPLALYAALFSGHDFWWKSLLPAAWAWSCCRVIAMTVTVFGAERAFRHARPDRKPYGRTTAVLGFLFAYVLLTIGGYKLVRYQLGEYSECPCELEGLVEAGVMLIAAAIAVAAASPVLSFIVKNVRRAAELVAGEKE